VSTPLDSLAAGARSILGRALQERELESFYNYLHLLQKWQKVHRLVGSTEPGWIVENLFLDSLLFLRVLPEDIRSMADLGSGAGFPGIPIKIVRPDLDIVLIESRERRVSFLSEVLRELALERVRVAAGRVEALPSDFKGAFEAVVMRCAGDAQKLLPQAARLLKPEGIIVVAGPPSRRPIDRGQWVEIPGITPARARRFAVYRPGASKVDQRSV
jgi:16S rRNA (guanine527-N7)-methyltransferase